MVGARPTRWALSRPRELSMLEVRQLHAGYGSVEILRGIDLDVGAGEIVAVLGSNGVGKSTLNNNISALYLVLIHILRCRRIERLMFRWLPLILKKTYIILLNYTLLPT